MLVNTLKYISLAVTTIILFLFLHEIYLTINGNRYLVWEFSESSATPIIFPNRIVTQGKDYIYGLNSVNGNIVWKYSTNGESYQLNHEDNNVLSLQKSLDAREVIFIDAITGQQIGVVQIPKDQFFMTANKNVAVILDPTSANKVVSATNINTGQVLWKLPISEKYGIEEFNMFGGLTHQYPEIIKDNIVVFWGDKYFTGVDLGNGAIKWQYPYIRSDLENKSNCNIIKATIFCDHQVLDFASGKLRSPDNLELVEKNDFNYNEILNHKTKNTNYIQYPCYMPELDNTTWCIDAKDKQSNMTKWKIPFASGDTQIDPYTNLFLHSYKTIKAYKD